MNFFSFKFSAIIFLGGLILLGGSIWLFSVPSVANYFIDKNEIGDAVGGMTAPIINLIGAMLVFFSFVVQYQANEMQKKALKEQQVFLEQQQFENTFFQLLTNHNEIVNDIDIQSPVNEADHSKTNMSDFSGKRELICSGRDSFKYLYNKFKILYAGNNFEDFERTIQDYRKFFEKWEADLGHYFRQLYYILRYIDEKGPKDDKQSYVRMLRANISKYESFLIFYNCCLAEHDKMKQLVIKYHFLHNMPFEEIPQKYRDRLDPSGEAYYTQSQRTINNIYQNETEQ